MTRTDLPTLTRTDLPTLTRTGLRTLTRTGLRPGACAAILLLSTLLGTAACAPGENVAPDPEAVDEATAEGVAPEEATAAGETIEPTEEAAPDAADGVDDALLDPDTATREELLAVPGLDATTVDALVAGRPYADMLEVDELLATALDESEREAVYAHLFMPLDLNNATAAEILLIPGVGDRMRHEFEEYRPYTSIEQFRREIGKYVDDEEVTRLERYVMIR